MADENEGVDNSEAQSADLDNLIDESAGALQEGEAPDLHVILDIPVTISMEIGDTSISIRELLRLNKGSVVELDRIAGDPLDVKVNGTLIARGEVVVISEKFGIRLTEIISAADRIKQLQQQH